MKLWIFKHQWVFLFVLYIGADFLDPSIPGVFFLDNDALFMDGVVQKKGSHSATTALPEPAPDHARLTQVVEPRHVPSRSMLGPRTPVGPSNKSSRGTHCRRLLQRAPQKTTSLPVPPLQL